MTYQYTSITEADLSWILLSISREILQKTIPNEILPLWQFEDAQSFAASAWDNLDVNEVIKKEIAERFNKFLFGPIHNIYTPATENPLQLVEYAYEIWDKRDAEKKQFFFYTSGSTGTPKACGRSEPLLWEESFCLKDLLAPYEQIISVVPLHHSYGFNTSFLLSLENKIKLLLLPAIPTMVLPKITPGTLLIGFPDFLKAIPDEIKFPDGVQIASATSHCPPEIFLKLNNAGVKNFIEIYGCSETGIIGYRTKNDVAFSLFTYWKREISEMGTGEEENFIRTSNNQNIKFPSQDHLEWHGDNLFSVKGRRDNAVQIAGVNVYPEHIAKFLTQHPELSHAIKECAVRPMAESEGRRLKAFVVPNGNIDVTTLRHIIKEIIRHELSAPERPVSITFGCALPKTSMGKTADWKISTKM